MKKRIISMFLVVALVVTMVATGNFTSEKKVLAGNVKTTLNMPITMYDHLSDNLLFEYDFGNRYSNELSLEGLGELTGKSAGKGLVENELSKNGTPVYKKEVVEKVADLVHSYLVDTHFDEGTNLYNQIYNQIVRQKAQENTILDNSKYNISLEQLGWKFENTTYSYENGQDKWKDNNGNVIWYRDNDWIHTNGDTAYTATFDFGKLEAGTYALTYYQKTNVKLEVTTQEGTTEIKKSGETFTINNAQNVLLKVIPIKNQPGSFTNGNLKKNDIKLFDNFTKTHAKKLNTIGFTYDENSSWTNSQWGGITCGNDEEKEISYTSKVTPEKTYELKYYNENDRLNVSVFDKNGKKLADGNNEFTVPAGVNEVVIKLSLNKNTNGTVRFDHLILKQKTNAPLGDYETSKNKFENGAGLADIDTCMDYAYYRLNTFWSDTRNKVSKKTDAYSVLQLDLMNNLYTFSNEYEMNYDVTNKKISQKTNVKPDSEIGFYPLDKKVLGKDSDLQAPFGTEMYNEYDGNNHNYHFSMKAKCQFLYKAEDNLVFNFNGDDDVYLYINGKLALDIGGAHLKRQESLDVNEMAERLGLEEGKVYSFDFFYMERHTTASNIKIETNMVLEQADAKPFVKIKDNEGNDVISKEVPVGDDVNIELGIKAGHDKMGNITFNDDKLDVKVGKDGIDLGKDVTVKDKLTASVTDKDGNVIKTISIDKEDLNNPEIVDKFIEDFSKIKLSKDETLTVSGLVKKVGYDEVVESNLNVDITADLKQYTDNGTIEEIPTDVPLAPVNEIVIPKNQPKANVKVSLKDKDGKDLTGKIARGIDVFVDYILTAKSDNMKNIGITDTENGFKIDKDGITIPDGFNIANGLTVDLVDKDGNVKESYTITKDDIDNNSDNYKKILEKLSDNNGFNLDNEESIHITGLNKVMDDNDIKAEAKGTITGPVPSYNEETKQLTVDWEKVTPTDKCSLSPKAKYNVDFVVDDGVNSSLEGKTNYKVESGKSTKNEPNLKIKKGYEFEKWTVTTDGKTTDVVDNPKDIIITGDTVFTAYIKPVDANYTVRYVDENDNDIANKVRKDAKYGDNVVENAIDIKGYTLNDSDTKTLEIDVDNNEIIFRYKTNEYPYTVKYVEKGTNKELADKVTGTEKYGKTVSSKAKDIYGYTLDGEDNKTLTIDTENNIIIYEYVKNLYNVKFKADDHGTVQGDTDQSVKFNETVKTVPIPKPDKGYEFLGWEKTTSKGTVASENPKEEPITENTVFTAKFGPLDYDYIVKYVDEDGNELLPNKQGGSKTFGTKVTENAEDIYGYTPDADEKSCTIDTENNVITFVYSKKEYDVSFKTDGNGEIVGQSDYKVKYNETVKTPEDRASEGYKFSEWTMKKGDEDEVVVDDPSTINITEDTVFIAHYVLAEYEYTVKYVDKEGNPIAEEVVKSAIFGTDVTESPIYIKGYRTTDGDKTITIKVSGNEIVFVYDKAREPGGKVKDANEDGTGDGNKNTTGSNPVSKNVNKDDNKDNQSKDNQASSTSTTSPKTGDINLYNVYFAMLLALLFAGFALIKIKKSK